MSTCAGMLENPSTLPMESYMEPLCTLDAQWWLVTPLLPVLATELFTWVPFWNRLTKCLPAIWTIGKTVRRGCPVWTASVIPVWVLAVHSQAAGMQPAVAVYKFKHIHLNVYVLASWKRPWWETGREHLPYFTVIYLLQCLHFTSYDKQWVKTKNMLL